MKRVFKNIIIISAATLALNAPLPLAVQAAESRLWYTGVAGKGAVYLLEIICEVLSCAILFFAAGWMCARARSKRVSALVPFGVYLVLLPIGQGLWYLFSYIAVRLRISEYTAGMFAELSGEFIRGALWDMAACAALAAVCLIAALTVGQQFPRACGRLLFALYLAYRLTLDMITAASDVSVYGAPGSVSDFISLAVPFITSVLCALAGLFVFLRETANE